MQFKVLPFFCFLLISFVVFAQKSYVEATKVYGYSGRELFSKNILIDSNDYLWITSSTHLIKRIGNDQVYYDYNHPYQKKLGHKIFIEEINPDKIIGFSDYGVFEFSIKKASINWIYITPKEDEIRFNNYLKDEKGNIWVVTMLGTLFHYNSKKGLVVKDLSKLIDTKYNNINKYKILKVLDENSVLIVVEAQGGIIQDLYTYSNGRLELCFKNQYFNDNELIYNMLAIENGKLFPKNKSGVFSFKDQKFQFNYVPEINSHVFKFYLNLKTAFNGVLHYKDDIFIAYSRTELVLFSLNSKLEIAIHKKFDGFNKITEVYLHENELWINHFSGITIIKLKEFLFKNIFFNKNNLSPFRSILKTKNGDLFTIINNELYRISKNDTIPIKVNYMLKKRNGKQIKALYGLKTYNDSLFFAYGWNNRILKVNHILETYETYYLPRSKLSIKDIEFIDDNQLLLGTTRGLYEFNLQTNEIKEYLFGSYDNLKNKSINEIYFDDSNQQLWVGTIENDGLYMKDLNSKNIFHYSSASKNKELINNNVNCLLPDPDNTNILWIGTEQGLQKLDIKSNTSQFFLTNKGLSSRVVSLVKAKKHLFVGTYNGLITIDSDNNIRRYDDSDGLPNKEFNKKSFFQDEDGSVYLGTVNGLTCFNPDDLIDKKYKNPKLELIETYHWDFNENEFKTNYKNLGHLNVFNISHKKNFLKLKFSINSLTNIEDVEYRYKLDTGNGWISLGNSNTLNLASLRSGKHNLTVHAIDSRGVLTNELKYKINVSQVFYKKGWFLLMSVSLGLSLFYRYFYEKEKKEKQRYSISLLKSQALLTQMTPHFINNVLNGIQSKIILKDELAVNSYIKSFSNLCKYTLNISSSQFISLEEEINYLNEFLSISQIKLDNSLDFKIKTKDNICIQDIYIPTMLLQPIIENAIEHGLLKKDGRKVLRVVFYKKNHKLYVEVEDNGIGKKAASLNQTKKKKDPFKRPHALEILKKRMKVLNRMFNIDLNYEYQDVYTKNSDSIDTLTGTKVILSLKICKTDFSKSYSINI